MLLVCMFVYCNPLKIDNSTTSILDTLETVESVLIKKGVLISEVLYIVLYTFLCTIDSVLIKGDVLISGVSL